MIKKRITIPANEKNTTRKVGNSFDHTNNTHL
jgi:hypothetical protein